MWDIEKMNEILSKPMDPETRWTYIVTNDKNEFLDRMEGIGKRGLLQKGDNLKCLEILDKVKAVREGADIFETFAMLKEWRDR